MTRQAPNLYRLLNASFCGVENTISPLTQEEIISAGFEPATRPTNYVEDTSHDSWMLHNALYLSTSHLIVNGPAGTGKDVWGDAYCHAYNLPYARFAFKQGTNPVDWIYRTTLRGDGKGGTETVEVEGDLLKACKGVTCKRDFTSASAEQLDQAISDMEEAGYKVVNDGGMLTITVPAVILFSDYDRATPDQLEILRQALELGKEKLTNPITGEMFEILPNTRFYFTANSGADGSGGTSNITQMKDSSLLSRCIGIHAPAPTPKFERMVVQAEFPQFDQDQVKLLVDCTRAIRKVAEEQDMGLEITLRQAKQWGHACLKTMKKLKITDFKKALKFSFVTIKGHLAETYNQDAFEGAIDPYLRSDVVDAQSKPQEERCPIDL